MKMGRFEVGEVVRVWIEEADRAAPHHLRVDVVEASRVWLVAPDTNVKLGDSVLIERSVIENARYQAAFEVESQASDSVAFKQLGEWERLQQRNFVRVSTRELPVVAIELAIEGIATDPDSESFEMCMLNVSSVGMMAETNMSLRLDDRIDCTFCLPGSEHVFTIPARVIRRSKAEGSRHLDYCYGFEFDNYSNAIQSEITRWVFREQIRRHNLRAP